MSAWRCIRICCSEELFIMKICFMKLSHTTMDQLLIRTEDVLDLTPQFHTRHGTVFFSSSGHFICSLSYCVPVIVFCSFLSTLCVFMTTVELFKALFYLTDLDREPKSSPTSRSASVPLAESDRWMDFVAFLKHDTGVCLSYSKPNGYRVLQRQ